MITYNLNPITTFVLLGWPVVAFWLYKTRPIGRATLWTILGAYMLLPVGSDIKISMVPDFNKSSIPNLAALVGCVVICGKSIRLSNGLGPPELLIAMFMICPFITCELNTDPLYVGPVVLPGLSSYDAGSAIMSQAITLIPFFLGRQFLRNGTDTKEILRVLIIAGLIYSIPALFEVRFSPQLHTWIYGFFPGGYGFEDQFRDGGFRPVVFMGHGLLVCFFFCTTAIAAAAFWRTNTQVSRSVNLPGGAITAYLSFVLVLGKTASSTAYAFVLVPLVYFAKPKTQLSFAVLLVSVALLYPVLRATNVFPTDVVLHLAGQVGSDVERVGSLNVRFRNENALLERASERFLFGWGGFGRGFTYNEYGAPTTAVDGTWIGTLSQFGFVGFLALFGVLTLPVFTVARAFRFAESTTDKAYLAAVALILAINVFDLLPNNPLRPWTWLLAGALLGRAEALLRWARLPPAAKMQLTASSSRIQKYPGIRTSQSRISDQSND
jgi:hypothetical protein